MDEDDLMGRARALATSALALCDATGADLAAGYLQLALDRMEHVSRVPDLLLLGSTKAVPAP